MAAPLEEVGIALVRDGRISALDPIACAVLGTAGRGVGRQLAELFQTDRLDALSSPPPSGNASAVVSLSLAPETLALVTASWVGDAVALRVQRVTADGRAAALAEATARLHSALDRRDDEDASKLNFRILIEASPELVAVHRDGRLVFVNAAGARYLGYDSPSEITGRRMLDFVHEEDRDAVMKTTTALPEGKAGPAVERRLLRRDGTEVIADITAMKLPFDGVLSTVVLAHDVTERRRLTTQMMEVDRMFAVGTLAAGVAHEINNPLAYVLANLDFVLDELAETPGDDSGLALGEIRAALGDARNGARRVRDIVRDLKTFSRPDREEVSAVSVEVVLESAISMVWNEIRHRATLVRELSSTAVLANESKLGQVFLNLLVNASQALPEGHASENRITVRSRSQGGFAVIEIEDSGAGISAENLSRVFDPFFTTRDVGQGTGLGLSVCQGIVRSLGGTIEVESRVGAGSTFRVRIPEAVVATAAAPLPAASATKLRPRVLVVDDEPLVLVALRRALEPEMEVHAAAGGREALALLSTAVFDVVLCDVMMPDVDGIEVHESLLARDPDLARRMVFLTGGAFTPRARAFVQRDGVAVVEKPFDPQQLRAVLRARMV